MRPTYWNSFESKTINKLWLWLQKKDIEIQAQTYRHRHTYRNTDTDLLKTETKYTKSNTKNRDKLRLIDHRSKTRQLLRFSIATGYGPWSLVQKPHNWRLLVISIPSTHSLTQPTPIKIPSFFPSMTRIHNQPRSHKKQRGVKTRVTTGDDRQKPHRLMSQFSTLIDRQDAVIIIT
jgi:hypothetical protein